MRKIACLFPGQGSQSVGMGKDLFEKHATAKAVFNEIDQLAGRSLSQLCFDGPEEELKRTVNTQPTILAVSLAAWRCYEQAGGPKPDFVAGHSLGEFSALQAAGALPLEACVKLVDKRARLMEECPKGAMSAVIGMSAEALEKCCADASAELPGQVVIVANFNTREQLVISGSPEAVALAGSKAKTGGAKVIPLPVGGAFHSPLMKTAAEEFTTELSKWTLSDAVFPVVQNFDAQSTKVGSELQAKLSQQMPSAVRWCASIEFMLSQGINTFIEIGPGKALAGMVKKIDRSASAFNIFDSESLEKTISELKQTATV
ncbi:MAG: ACP S-malonyltransferase [Candidatus Obscuribacterales bacterium]|nr:ACP S-malonyltransferase [Candidatus Obscuribacterales bacterium]